MALLWVVAVAAFVRFVFIPHPSFGTDMALFRQWGQELASEPIGEFYENNPGVDHLPGDLWIHWLLAETYQHFSPDFSDRAFSYEELLKIPPGVADIGIAVLGFFMVRKWAGPRAGLGAAWFLALNPALWFISTIWGQWDSISAFFALLALYCLATRWWFLSFALLSYSVLIKPQLAALGPLFVLIIILQHLVPILARHNRLPRLTRWLYPDGAPATTEGRDSLIEKSFLAVGGSALVFAAVCLPFNVGIPPIGSVSAIDRVRAALDLYDATTMGAFNFWNTGLGGPISYTSTRISDSGSHWFGWTYQTWGTALTVTGYIITFALAVIGWRSKRQRIEVWAAAAIMLTLFVFPTRIHERYFVPALVFCIVLAFVVPRFKPVALVLTVALFFNIVYVFDVYNDFIGRQTFYDFFFDDWFVPTMSWAVVLGYLALMILGFFYATEPRLSFMPRIVHPKLRRHRPTTPPAAAEVDQLSAAPDDADLPINSPSPEP